MGRKGGKDRKLVPCLEQPSQWIANILDCALRRSHRTQDLSLLFHSSLIKVTYHSVLILSSHILIHHFYFPRHKRRCLSKTLQEAN